MIKLNTTLLRDIMIDFSSGNILWGLLRLNEYTTKDSLLRKATLRKYKEEIEVFRKTLSLTNKLIGGLTLNELSCNEQFLVRNLSRNIRRESKENFKVVVKTKERKVYSCNRLKRRIS